MYPACLSDVCEDGNYFLKLTRAQLNSHIFALAVSGLNSELQSETIQLYANWSFKLYKTICANFERNIKVKVTDILYDIILKITYHPHKKNTKKITNFFPIWPKWIWNLQIFKNCQKSKNGRCFRIWPRIWQKFCI